MTRRLKQGFMVAILALMASAIVGAHEQKFMGTVASIDGEHLTVATTEGKSVMVMLDAKTKIFRGKDEKKADDIKKDDRIVVTTTDGKDKAGKSMLMAKEIRLGTAGAGKN